MLNTGALVMDRLNYDWQHDIDPDAEFSAHGQQVPFTIKITESAIPDGDSRHNDHDNFQLADYNSMKQGLMRSRFPEEWIDWSEWSDGEPVISDNEASVIEKYEDEVLGSIDSFLTKDSVTLAMPTIPPKMNDDTIIVIDKHRSEGEPSYFSGAAEGVLLGSPIQITDERRAALLELAQADGQTWTKNQEKSGWTDHMAEMMYGPDLDLAVIKAIGEEAAAMAKANEDMANTVEKVKTDNPKQKSKPVRKREPGTLQRRKIEAGVYVMELAGEEKARIQKVQSNKWHWHVLGIETGLSNTLEEATDRSRMAWIARPKPSPKGDQLTLPPAIKPAKKG